MATNSHSHLAKASKEDTWSHISSFIKRKPRTWVTHVELQKSEMYSYAVLQFQISSVMAHLHRSGTVQSRNLNKFSTAGNCKLMIRQSWTKWLLLLSNSLKVIQNSTLQRKEHCCVLRDLWLFEILLTFFLSVLLLVQFWECGWVLSVLLSDE